MNGLATWFAFSLWLLLASLSSPVFASYKQGLCESRLLGEFAHRPNDSKHGLITNRVRMTPETLIAAYQQGIFPWVATSEGNAVWHSPPERGVLIFDHLHLSSKDRKFIRQTLENPEYEVTIDRAFSEVIKECAEMVRWVTHENGDRVTDGHWISEDFIRNYIALFDQGFAHSVEVWHHGILVAGLYGTFVDGVFAGESMFHKENDAIKLAMHVLIERLRANGHTFIDTQQAKGLSLKWGAEMVSRDHFQKMLRDAQAANRPW